MTHTKNYEIKLNGSRTLPCHLVKDYAASLIEQAASDDEIDLLFVDELNKILHVDLKDPSHADLE